MPAIEMAVILRKIDFQNEVVPGWDREVTEAAGLAEHSSARPLVAVRRAARHDSPPVGQSPGRTKLANTFVATVVRRIAGKARDAFVINLGLDVDKDPETSIEIRLELGRANVSLCKGYWHVERNPRSGCHPPLPATVNSRSDENQCHADLDSQ